MSSSSCCKNIKHDLFLGTSQPRGQPGGNSAGAEDPRGETGGPGGRALREGEDAAVQGARDHDEAAAGAAAPGQRDDPDT